MTKKTHHDRTVVACFFRDRLGVASFPMPNLLSRAYVSLPMPGDECETWTREQLIEMNARFVAALEQAFALGLEHPTSASDQVKLPSHGPRWATPLCPEVWNGLLRSAASSATVFVARG